MIFAMVKEYALNLKRENHQRKQRRKARLRKYKCIRCDDLSRWTPRPEITDI
jgi:hypothetical protein